MKQLADHIWFVRSNGGSGSYPVTRQGWRCVGIFVAGMAASALLGALTATVAATWIWAGVAGAGMIASAAWLILTPRDHTDYSITYDQYVKEMKNA